MVLFVVCCHVHTIIVISYNQNVICSTKYIWQIFQYFVYFSLKHIPLGEQTQLAISCICTCQIGMQMMYGMNLLYLYLPNWHANDVRYDDHLSSLSLWYPELASIRERYFALFSFGKISLSVGPYGPVLQALDLATLDLDNPTFLS